MRIAVLVTVHNRADTTVKGLSRLASLSAAISDTVEFKVFMVDDGSTDNTTGRVLELPLDITVVPGTGSLYWNRGMALAFAHAQRADTKFDAYMLYNDDIILDENFIAFVQEFGRLTDKILVGAFREPLTSKVSYSGFTRTSRLRPLAFQRPELTGELVPVDTFNGNLVLIPARSFEALGGLDPVFTHSLGDLDLGLRAQATGVHSYVYGPAVGTCSMGTSLDARIRAASTRDRWKLLFGYPHGPGPYLRFARRHGTPGLLPVYAIHTTVHRLRKLFWRRAR